MAEDAKAPVGWGCACALLGGIVTALLAAPRAAFSVDGGFEDQARDLSVPFVELPAVVLAGALLPLVGWALTWRLSGRPAVAAGAALACLVLGVWCLLEVWSPPQPPDPGDGAGI